jgi:hypothetical protein
VLRREPGGELLDLEKRRVVSISELREDVRAGRRFRVEDREGGRDCTYAVLGCVVKGGTAGSRDGELADPLSALVRNVLDWAAEDVAEGRGSRGEGVMSRARRRRRTGRRHSSSIGPS